MLGRAQGDCTGLWSDPLSIGNGASLVAENVEWLKKMKTPDKGMG